MSIQDKLREFKGHLRNPDVILTALIIGVSLVSFFLGRISVRDGLSSDITPQKTLKASLQGSVASPTRNETSPKPTVTTSQSETQKGYVASKSGTKYHLPWCGSAKQIKEENKIWFATKEEAEKAGYTPASNCKGI
ncbi:MAG: hypothetical protein WAW13_01085 [Minisyncoccia bacterium]